jgi:hypothetical protein
MEIVIPVLIVIFIIAVIILPSIVDDILEGDDKDGNK